jgi:hypothetical protein
MLFKTAGVGVRGFPGLKVETGGTRGYAFQNCGGWGSWFPRSQSRDRGHPWLCSSRLRGLGFVVSPVSKSRPGAPEGWGGERVAGWGSWFPRCPKARHLGQPRFESWGERRFPLTARLRACAFNIARFFARLDLMGEAGFDGRDWIRWVRHFEGDMNLNWGV